jgi:RNA polymerase sigma-70 factor, ECF subfamily
VVKEFPACGKEFSKTGRRFQSTKINLGMSPKKGALVCLYLIGLQLAARLNNGRAGESWRMHILWLAAGSDASFALPTALGKVAIEERRSLTHRERVIQLFREIRTSLYSYLVCVGLKPHEADDIVQEAFLRLYRELELGTKIEEPRAWVFRVARNVSLNMQRDQRRLVCEADLGSEDETKLEQSCHPEPNPEQLYLKKEVMFRLDIGIAKLTEQQRQCVYLRAQGLRYREIAVVLGVSVSSAAEILQRAIVRLTGEING